MTTSEEKTCQNCKNKFTLEPVDFEYCERFQVSPPTWCFDCRLQRRMNFRNERALYKRPCNAPSHTEEILSIYSPDKDLKVYDQKFFFSDEWDALEYGRDYDFNRPFFEQFKDLIRDVPWMALYNMNQINSEYCHMTLDNKNCYLVFGGDYNEDCMYSTFNFHSRSCLDMHMSTNCELSYDIINSRTQYNCKFINWAKDCSDSAFLENCVGVNNCIGCVNLRNQSYCIFNKQYSKEDYEEEKKKYDFSDYNQLTAFKKEFDEFKKKFPKKFANLIRTENSSGERINDAKNCLHCFEIFGPAENMKDVFMTFNNYKDSYSCSHGGHGVEQCYECTAVFDNCQRLFGCNLMSSTYDAFYSYNCRSSSNLFGCVGLNSKQYCIFNKQYSKEEYAELVPKIKDHMDKMPYSDKKGRVYTYGHFFPVEVSPFAYNETIAQEYFPLTKEEAEEQGFDWHEEASRNYQVTIKNEELPPKLSLTSSEITKEVIECAHKGECKENCSRAFRILPQEFEFYKRIGVALPRLCPNCRHVGRLKAQAPLKLWTDTCHCGGEKDKSGVYQNTATHPHGKEPCQNTFQTPYDPAKNVMTYCETCYQQEVT